MVLHSAKYMSQSASEIADMVFGLPRMNREIRKLRGMGYHVKNVLDIAQNKPDDNTVVYTSRAFQPYAEAFDEAHCRFVGPSVREVEPQGKGGRPLVFASLGTVINDRPDFYRTLIEALHDEDVDLLESCGKAFGFSLRRLARWRGGDHHSRRLQDSARIIGPGGKSPVLKRPLI